MLRFARPAPALLFALALSGCGELGLGLGGTGTETGGGGQTGTSAQIEAMHAIGQLIELDEASSSEFVAQLAVLTTSSGEVEALTGVSDAFVEIGGERRSLPTTDFVGIFELRFDGESEFAPVEGEEVRFGYTITNDDGEQTEVDASVFTPPPSLTAVLQPAQIYFANEPIELTIEGWDGGGWVQVVDVAADAPTYSTLDSSLPGVVDQRTQLRDVETPVFVIPREAIPVEGTYRIEIASLEVADAESAPNQLTSGLGSYSWFGSGRRIALEVTVE